METLGTDYGGWSLPINSELNENSIIYSVGVGEDISFDLKLQDKYHSKILLIDPTPRAIRHFKEAQQYFKNPENHFTGNIQPDYLNLIQNLKPNFDKFSYIEKGLHNEKGKLKFYKQSNPDYVSQSLIPNMYSDKYDEVEVDTLKNMMRENNHAKIDLLKLDIEGSEIEVLNNMLDDKIFPTYLCIEFDLYLKKKDVNHSTEKLINRLKENNYQILDNQNLNITFKYIVSI